MIEIKEIQAKETWDMRHRVMWSHMPFDFVKAENDEEGHHFGVFKNDSLVSIISLFIEGDRAQFRKLATEEHEQGQGFASMLLEHVFQFSRNKGATIIWCNARQNVAAYYKRFDLLPTDKTFTRGGIDFIILEKAL